MSRDNSYWERRTKAIMDKQQYNADIANANLRKAYIKAVVEVQNDINNMFKRFKKYGGLTSEQARELLKKELTSVDKKSLKRLISKTKDPELEKLLRAQLDAPAYAARIARREMLRENLWDNINGTMNRVAIEENRIDKNLFITNINESYYTHMYEVQRGMKLGFDVGTLGNDTINAIMKRPFHGANYSKRIWGNTQELTDKLYENIVLGFLNGKPLKNMIAELQETMHVGENAARRLIKTESAYYTNMAAVEGYKECGIDRYRFNSKLDLKVSNVCRNLDGKIFSIDKAQAGENLPPMHPYCRSSIGPVIDGGVAQRIGVRTRDVVTGKSEVIKGDITFKEWYDKYVVDRYGEDKVKELEKKANSYYKKKKKTKDS